MLGFDHFVWALKVVLLRDIEDDEAEALVKKCPVQVFDIEDIGKGIATFVCPVLDLIRSPIVKIKAQS